MTLNADGLGVAIGDPQRWLFRGLEATFGPGLTAVVGPNGSGKTTLLRTVAGLLDPTEGDVRLDGRPLGDIDRNERARALAYLPQSTPLSHDLVVRELVMLGRLPHLPRLGAPSRADRNAASQALAEVELDGFGHRRMSTLSGGERQRVMLARMLASSAHTLVLDEPTTALDVRHCIEVLELCARLGSQGRVVVVSLHDLALARRYADRALCMTTGPEGRVHLGAAADVLHPNVMADVFGVPMELRGNELVVAPRP